MTLQADKDLIERAFIDRSMLRDAFVAAAVERAIGLLDRGELRVAEFEGEGAWKVNEWAKKAILLYFALKPMEALESGPFTYLDKIPIKRKEQLQGVRAVPGAVIRYGAHAAPGTILMPSFVNIGAFVGEGTMVDTWATVGSCAQVGKRVHLSGGVGLGGVLEPPQASPVIIEDDAFLGSRCIVVEGVRVGARAVLGANVVLTASTKIIDVSKPDAPEHQGYIPEGSVVIPGTRPKDYPGGRYQIPCALIIGQRKPSTDLKTSLNEALRDFGVSV
jgi:2,3,4,5-tetrahydropyridine-2-carboxylate N-succinyltransferase